MLPSGSGIQVVSSLDVDEQTSRTYYLDRQRKRIIGISEDYLKNIEQAVYLMLLTERYEYAMFSWNYGIELNDLFGNVKEFVISHLIIRVKAALLQDDRIDDIQDFYYSINKNKYLLSFTVVTEYGNIDVKDVELNV